MGPLIIFVRSIVYSTSSLFLMTPIQNDSKVTPILKCSNIIINLALKSFIFYVAHSKTLWIHVISLNVENVLKIFMLPCTNTAYTGSLAPAVFSGAVFTHAHFWKIAQISSLFDFHLSEGPKKRSSQGPGVLHVCKHCRNSRFEKDDTTSSFCWKTLSMPLELNWGT